MSNLAISLLALSLLLLGAAQGKSVYTAEPPLGNFLVRKAEVLKDQPPETPHRTREIGALAYDCASGNSKGPFGEKIHATGPKAQSNPWRYATKYLDEETGLYYFGHRYHDPITGQFLSREPLGESEALNLYQYGHGDPINKVDVRGLAAVVTSSPDGKDVLVNNETTFWLIYNMMAEAGLVGKLDPNGGKPSFADAMVVAGKLGGTVKTYSKYFPGNASGENSPHDLWIMPFRVPHLPGSPGGNFDSFLINSEAKDLAQGNGFYLDALDVRAITAAGEATSSYPWGSLSKNEAYMLSDRGAVLTWLDSPLATLGDGSGEYWGPEWGKWQPIGGRNGGLYDYAMAANPFGTPRDVRNMLAIEIGTAGLAKGWSAVRMLGSGKGNMPLTNLRSWWNTGSEADPYWRSLSARDKAFYEIGQKTLPGKTFEKYAHLGPVARGKALVDDMGWARAVWPQGTGYRLGAGTTLNTGPTPLVRWAFPRAAGASAAGGAIYYFTQED